MSTNQITVINLTPVHPVFINWGSFFFCFSDTAHAPEPTPSVCNVYNKLTASAPTASLELSPLQYMSVPSSFPSITKQRADGQDHPRLRRLKWKVGRVKGGIEVSPIVRGRSSSHGGFPFFQRLVCLCNRLFMSTRDSRPTSTCTFPAGLNLIT